MQVGAIEIPQAAVRAICLKWGIAELSLFGSAARDDFGPDSDIDLLVMWGPGVKHRYEDLLAIKDEFAALFGREVDLAQKHVVEADHNPYRRKNILENARRLYAA